MSIIKAAQGAGKVSVSWCRKPTGQMIEYRDWISI